MNGAKPWDFNRMRYIRKLTHLYLNRIYNMPIKIKGSNKKLDAYNKARNSTKGKAAAIKRAKTPTKPAVFKLVKAAAQEPPVQLYWAYGSNLNKRQMLGRCPAATPLGQLYLQGRLVFRVVADVVGSDDPNELVAGGLWRITPACEAALDNYEGVAHNLYVKKYLTLRIRGEKVRCLYYQMVDDGIAPPRDDYLNTIVQGYRDFGLDFETLDRAVQHSKNEKLKTPAIKARYARYNIAKVIKSIEGGNK